MLRNTRDPEREAEAYTADSRYAAVIGHVVRETPDKIVVFGQSDYRFDIPKSRIIAAGRNVILNIDFPEIFKYQVDRKVPLPTGELVKY
jgi:hypothetical protein